MPTLLPDTAVLDHGVAALVELRKIVADHPDLPPLISATVDSTGVRAMPWLLARPVGALGAWVDALPHGQVFVRHRPAVTGGTELYATVKLGGTPVELAVQTWRYDVGAGDDGVEVTPNGLLSRAHLRRLAQAEDDGSDCPATGEPTQP